MKKCFSIINFYFFFLPAILIAQQPYPKLFLPKGFGGGGYMYAPSISTHDPNLIALNCDMGGIYYSQNTGQNWTMIPNQMLVGTVKGKIQFTQKPNILYTVRRSTTNLSDPLFRGELAKSTDGGVTWKSMPDPTSSGVHRLEVDPNSTDRLILNEYNQLFFSNNGGMSWTSVFKPNNEKVWLGGVFWDNQNIYVGTDHGLLISKNGGLSFTIEKHNGLPDGTGIYNLAGAKSDTTIRLFCIPALSSDLYAWYDPLNLKGNLKGAFRMDYSTSAIWTNTRGNIPADIEIAWIDLAKNNTQIIWADGQKTNDYPQVFKSTDGGQTWTNTLQLVDNQNITTGWAGKDGAFWLFHTGAALGFDVSDTDPNMVIRTHGQGEITTDGGTSWRSIYVHPDFQNAAGQPTPINKQYKSSGLDVTTSHHLFWKNSKEMFLSNTDVGMTYSPDSGETWNFSRNTFESYGTVANNNWYRILQRSDNQQFVAAVCQINDLYLGYRIADKDIEGGGLILHSTNGGITFDTLHNFGHPVVWLELNKSNPSQMWASVVNNINGGIFYSQNSGETWTKLPAPPRTEGHPYNIISLADGSLVVTFSARALPDGVTLTESSGVFYSTDKGNSWQDRSDKAMRFYTKDLVVDQHDPSGNTWYATVWGRFTIFSGANNAGNGGLYKTINRGQTWTRIFANENAESFTIHPLKPNTAYLTVENNGLYFTQNLNATIPVFEKVTTFPWWRPKRVFFNPENACEVWVTTMGGGLWKGETDHNLITPIISSNSDACEDSTVQYSTQAQIGATYLWLVKGGQILSGQGTNLITVKWGASGVGEINVEISQ